MKKNVQHAYYFVSKKQKKKHLLRYLKNIYYIFYKFEKKKFMMSNLQIRTNKEY